MYVCMYAVLNKFATTPVKYVVIFLENNKVKQLNNPLNSPIQGKI